ncbi:hypothetical protein BHM03_00011971 [Ensete ventricosum]|nr:hypothetical protein BHM03_00011971 [Ensete ventricosum]
MAIFSCVELCWRNTISQIKSYLYSFFHFSPLFVTWKKAVNGAEPRLRGCIGTLEARCIINGFRDYALTRYLSTAGSIKS